MKRDKILKNGLNLPDLALRVFKITDSIFQFIFMLKIYQLQVLVSLLVSQILFWNNKKTANFEQLKQVDLILQNQ